MDIAALTAFLAPCLGALLGLGQRAGEELGARLGGSVWEHAERLWARLGPKVGERAAAEEAARDVAVSPDDARARAALELQLEKLLSADEGLTREVVRLWEDARAAGVVAVGARSVAVGGDVSGVIATGDHNVIRE